MQQVLEKDLIGWKIITNLEYTDGVLCVTMRLIKLHVPKGVKCNISDDGFKSCFFDIPGDGVYIKCRCEKAKVLDIYDVVFPDDIPDTIYDLYQHAITKNSKQKSITNHTEFNKYQQKTVYRIGRYVYPDKFDDTTNNTCSNGIHFFRSREEAICYGLEHVAYFTWDHLVKNIYWRLN